MADETGAASRAPETGSDDAPNIEERLSKLEKMLKDTSKALEDERKGQSGQR
jgi:flagellar motility protein MotE (MotC chaperone)